MAKAHAERSAGGGRGDALSTAAAGGAGLIAAAAATCCVLPLALAIIGLAGGWLAFLGPLVVHRQLVLVIAAVPLVFAWWRLRRRAGCAPRRVGRVAVSVTAAATGLWLLAVAAPWWEARVTAVLFRWWANA
jgi:mercuric ion transport protein